MGMDRNKRRIQMMFLAVTLITPIFLVAGVGLGGLEEFIHASSPIRQKSSA